MLFVPPPFAKLTWTVLCGKIFHFVQCGAFCSVAKAFVRCLLKWHVRTEKLTCCGLAWNRSWNALCLCGFLSFSSYSEYLDSLQFFLYFPSWMPFMKSTSLSSCGFFFGCFESYRPISYSCFSGWHFKTSLRK